MDYEANDNPSETPEMEGRYPEPIPAEQGEERLKASEVHLRAVQRACEILDAIPFNKSIADLRWAGRRLYIECKRLAARPQPKEPQAEASREALIDRIADLERALQAERGAYDDLAAFTASLPKPADEKGLMEAEAKIDSLCNTLAEAERNNTIAWEAVHKIANHSIGQLAARIDAENMRDLARSAKEKAALLAHEAPKEQA